MKGLNAFWRAIEWTFVAILAGLFSLGILALMSFNSGQPFLTIAFILNSGMLTFFSVAILGPILVEFYYENVIKVSKRLKFYAFLFSIILIVACSVFTAQMFKGEIAPESNSVQWIFVGFSLLLVIGHKSVILYNRN